MNSALWVSLLLHLSVALAATQIPFSSAPSLASGIHPATELTFVQIVDPKPPRSAPVARKSPQSAAPQGGETRSISGSLRSSSASPSVAIAAQVRHLPHPTYPPESRQAGEEGLVLVSVQITSEGTCRSAQIAQTSGYARLDQASLRAACRGSFQPARMGGVALESFKKIAFRFRLED